MVYASSDRRVASHIFMPHKVPRSNLLWGYYFFKVKMLALC